MYAITSVPCFEFWLLLHFIFTTQDYYEAGGSVCDRLMDDLKSHVPEYDKGASSIFEITKGRIETAMKNAKQVETYCHDTGTDTPSTKMHEFVEYLMGLKKKAERKGKTCR